MTAPGRRVRLPARLRHPKTTVRWRLTLLYGGLFLVCGAALLAVTYTLVARAAVTPGEQFTFVPAAGKQPPLTSQQPALKSPPAGTRLVRSPPVDVPPALRRVLSSPNGRAAVRFVGAQQRIADLHQLEIESAIALAIMAIISALLGWVVAGRVLRPLRTITAATQEISAASLHRRLGLPGPRDELRVLADTIDGLLERLESAFDAQRRFIANASHELRTPLTAVRALLEMVISDPRATVPNFRQTCRQALEESEQQEQLIDALLALAQGQRGLDRHETFDLAPLVNQAVQAHRSAAVAGHVELDAALAPATVDGDPRLVARLVSNLLQNALRYNQPGGRVCVRVHADAGEACLAVANTGPPVPAEEIERLLQPFQRLAPERVGRRDGFGLGLSIVAAIATAHDAALEIQPGAAGGLHVEVRFPAATASPAAAAAAAGAVGPPAAEPPLTPGTARHAERHRLAPAGEHDGGEADQGGVQRTQAL